MTGQVKALRVDLMMATGIWDRRFRGAGSAGSVFPLPTPGSFRYNTGHLGLVNRVMALMLLVPSFHPSSLSHVLCSVFSAR